MVPQHVIAGSRKRAPNVEKALVLLLRHAEVPHLDDEIHLGLLHVVDEDLKAFVRIVHDVLVHIGDDPEPQGLAGGAGIRRPDGPGGEDG